MFVLTDTESGLVVDLVPTVRDEENGAFYDELNDIYYHKDICMYYELDDVPKWVRPYNYKYTPEDGFKKAFDPMQERELRLNQVQRYKEMTRAMAQYDAIKSSTDDILIAILQSQLAGN